MTVTVDFDSDKSLFVIQCPVWANDLVLSKVPNRRWSKPRRAWTTPLLKQNVAHIKELSTLAGVRLLPAAARAVSGYEKKKREHKADGFPSWYKFKTKPRKHQAAALAKIYKHDAVALFMEMQTGKSKTAIDYCVARRMEDRIRGMLVITKLSLRQNWGIQLETHCPIPYSIHYPETSKQKQFDRWLGEDHDFRVMVVGWESLSAGGMVEMCERFLLAVKSAVVGDETTYIANHKATRTKRVCEFRNISECRLALTGTPVLEGPMNLYSQFDFLDPDIIGIGDFYAFRNRYAVMGGYRREIRPGVKQPMEIIGYQNLDELNGLIAPYTFQVLKKDAYDLPPKRREVRTVQVTKEQRRLLDQIRKTESFSLKDKPEVVMQNVLESALRRHQIAGGYAVDPREVIKTKMDGTLVKKLVYDPIELVKPKDNPKMIEVMNVLEGIKKKKQFLLWAVYMPEIRALIGLAKGMGFRIGELHGGIPNNDRQAMVNRFENGDFDGIIGNASTGGMGYTMQAAELNLFYNNTFKMIDRVQAEERSYGDGQTKSGMWTDIIAENTMDVTTMEALIEKKNLADYMHERLADIMLLLDGQRAGQGAPIRGILDI